ncbi:50S ribosomal protein L21, mitochondrial [Turnera subulata]|uniref:Large ribosomal subunit protein bL21m n=1 Tax=Turnera subulata TaxID=218843 RepID=A0A9Q0JB53_9ROSI|nr:50S ribosomal protein L21, mitochondrial [Turnera subulata]
MAQRRCLHTLTRQATALFSSLPHRSLETLTPFLPHTISLQPNSLKSSTPLPLDPAWTHIHHLRYFSSNSRDDPGNERSDDDDDDEDNDDEEAGESDVDEDEDDDDDVGEYGTASSGSKREYSAEEKEAEAAAIGYKVVGPLLETDKVFKSYAPVFAVVQIGSHQFKVSNGDSIFTERLKFCEVNDKLILNKVLLLGSSTQTIIGRPTVPDAAVHAVVEEHALDAKVIIFKKKRRKNYRRTKGHRQELTKLRITDIQGIERPKPKVNPKPKKTTAKEQEKAAKEQEKAAVAA